MEHHYITHQHLTLHYVTYGTGTKSVFAFHGFGQTQTEFARLVEHLGEDYKVYSFDLPFHGETKWNAGEKPLDKDFFRLCMPEIFLRHKIEKLSVVAFSIGAKFALTIIESFPKKIESVTLLAPDGIVTNPWYWLATYPVFSRAIFKHMIINPTWFLKASKWAATVGIISKSLQRFAASQMNTEARRTQVYYTWVVLRQLNHNKNRIASIINSQSIQITIVAGSLDTVITPHHLKSFTDLLSKPEVLIIPCRHHQLLNRWMETIR